MANVEIKIVENSDNVIASLGSLIETESTFAISERGVFNIGLSGGSLIQSLEKCLPSLNTTWEKWRVYFCDERVVPFESPDSTYGLYWKALNDKVPLKEDQFVKIIPGLSAEEAAVDYENKLKNHFGDGSIPAMDMLLLGVGPDGHTCSLFPGHRLLEETKAWVAPITDSPKPPSSRVTLTFPVINNARICVFPLAGQGKASILKRILDDKEDLPVTRVSPRPPGKVYWIIDKDAASELKASLATGQH